MRRLPILLVLLSFVSFADAEGTPVASRVLRVCSDPNNLPFSNSRGEGFENRLAEILARELGARVEYTFWAQRRGFLRNTLNAGLCDVVMGLPSELEHVATTEPYYRSSYAFVTQPSRKLRIRSLDDARLRKLTVGVPLIGDDYANTPPAQALVRRGIIDNLRGYSVYGDYAQASPPAELVRAVATGEIDVAIAWGPLAGYFARESSPALTVTPVAEARDGANRLQFAISVGVRKGDASLKSELERALLARRPEVTALLDQYGVPRL
jgi:quinoprotein dehydrogenase-associated probable ABC transporter substrate-binding protein